MEIFQYLLLIIVVLLAFPAGIIISKLTKEELKSGRIWFKILIVAAIIVIISSFCMKACTEDFLFITASMLFIIIVSAISLKKSYRRR